jgi:NADP-dependent 3-hydroxy acid dehydrogenase YdfG
MSLSGRVAAITGASAGIGLACAKHFARAGAAVVLGARRVPLLEATARAITDAGGRAAVVETDVTRERDVQALVDTAVRQFGRLDVMICNAGFGYYGRIDETPADVMRQMMDVNYMGTFHGARAALPVFRAQNSGHLIFISSIVGRRGIPFMGGYTATKSAQAGLAEALRAEFAGTPIHVSCVYPASTPTEFTQVMARDYGYQISGLGPKQTADAVAEAIVACAERPRPEVYPYRVSRALAVLNALAPAFADRFVRKFGRHRVIASQAATPLPEGRERASARELREQSEPAQRQASERVGESEGRSPSDQ